MTTQHIVLVPGFVGFDALGQLRYYVGVSKVFREFADGRQMARARVHYFDNFPTASVANRAQRLKVFLAKRFARAEISPGDEITLIGHSTGGLDIRKLLIDLKRDKHTIGDDRIEIPNEDILNAIHKIVFLSVPHYGTNIADYVSSFREPIQTSLKAFVEALRTGGEPVSTLRSVLNRKTMWKADALTALEDALNESDEVAGEATKPSDAAIERANEREARAELGLWLEHMAADFSAIEDLRSAPCVKKKPSSSLTASASAKPDESPAHFSAQQRADELADWGGRIRTRSYATVVPKQNVDSALLSKRATSLKTPAMTVASVLEVLVPDALESRLLDFVEKLAVRPAVKCFDDDPNLLFRLVYALCATPEPFETPSDPTAHPAPELFPQAASTLQLSQLTNRDNDGIANTQSMFWPYDKAQPDRHRLLVVAADHGDIVGHHDLQPQTQELLKDRRHDGYDIFQSKSDFQFGQFKAVWEDIAKFVFNTD